MFVKKGVVIPLGADGDFDDYYTYNQAVVYANGRFFLYYTGHDGSNVRTGLAISKDGVHFVKKGVVIPLGADGDFDDYHTYYQAVVYANGRFFLYYTGYDGSKWRTGLAISKDGVHFVKKGVVIPLGADGDFDGYHTYNQAVVYANGRFFLYYTGHDGSKWRTGLAISKDGVHFVKKGVVIPLGADGDFDGYHTYYPGVVCANGRFFLYYTGHDGSNVRTGLAISKDGVHFVKKGVVIPLGADGDFDDYHTYYPGVVCANGRFFLYYTGHDGSKWRTGLAISKGGI